MEAGDCRRSRGGHWQSMRRASLPSKWVEGSAKSEMASEGEVLSGLDPPNWVVGDGDGSGVWRN